MPHILLSPLNKNEKLYTAVEALYNLPNLHNHLAVRGLWQLRQRKGRENDSQDQQQKRDMHGAAYCNSIMMNNINNHYS